MHKKIGMALKLLAVLGLIFGQQAEAEDVRAAAEEGNIPGRYDSYEWNCSQPDGQNGYYLTAPEVVIKNLATDTITRYRVDRADGTVYEESVSSFQEVCLVPEEAFQEGENHLQIWMEEIEPVQTKSQEQEKYVRTKENIAEHVFHLEYQDPKISVTAEKEPHEWYQKSTVLRVRAEQSISGLKEIRCYQGEEEVKKITEKEGVFEITKGSADAKPVIYRVVAEDEAGRISEQTGEVYIDTKPPVLQAEGMPVEKITNQAVTLKLCAQEDNLLVSCELKAEQELPDGTSCQMEVPPWNMAANKAEMEIKCNKSGIYRIRWNAADASGQSSEKMFRFILDLEAPVIHLVQGMNGREVQYFQWNEDKDKVVEDFTAVETACFLDGKPYLKKQKIQKEGQHIFQIQAKDAAGNKVEETAVFQIDHTPPVICFDGLDKENTLSGRISLKIYTENEKDHITQISLNGENMEIDETSRSYLYCLEESGTYEIEVTAEDAAGNKAKESRKVVIVDGKVESLSDGLRETAAPEPDAVLKEEQVKNKRLKYLFWMLTGGAVVVIVIMGGLAEKEKNSRKREDAR